MAPPLEPVAPQAPDPEPIELKPVTPAEEPELDVAASAPAPPAEQVTPELPALVTPAPVEETPIELSVVESLAPPAPEASVAEEPAVEPMLDIPPVASQPGAFRVVVRLSDGDGVEVGEFRDFGTAMQGAQEVIDQFSHSNGSWPFYAGRFIRPDLIISVDVVDASS